MDISRSFENIISNSIFGYKKNDLVPHLFQWWSLAGADVALSEVAVALSAALDSGLGAFAAAFCFSSS